MRQPYDNMCGIRQRRGIIALAVAACFSGNAALANPTGPAVVHGQASVTTQGNTLTVTNTPGTIINWRGFSIAGSEITRFIQQSQASSVFNRVVGINPSAILGTLQSNGRVFLINPNGITIGPGANIDVAGFVASTLNLSDGDFLSGRMRFTETPGAGSVVNQGTITTAAGGMVYLVGQDVQNSGIIRSPQGEIMLAAGRSVELVDAGTPEVRVQVTAPDGEALNLGQLIAEGGRIGMYGALVRHSGVAEANTAVVGENGKIVFRATRDVTLEAGSRIAANGPQGGSVTVQSKTGTLRASGSIEATGASEQGGTVRLLGHHVGLTGQAQVDVSGERGGGTVLVGGDFQGGNPGVQNAQRTYVGSGTRITADARADGDGGKVIVWADGDTRFDGEISARGGAQSGDGGFVEVSGKENLNFYGRVDVGAPSGLAGTILLDPRDITIQDTGANDTAVSPGSPNGESVFFAEGGNSDFTISDVTLEALEGNIVLQAERDITVGAGLSAGGLVLANQTAGERVVFQAGNDVVIGSPVSTGGAAIFLEADSPHQPGGADGAGLVQINLNATVNSNGGAITLIGGDASNPQGGFKIDADVNAGVGGINVGLSQSGATLDFFIGAGGNTQLSSSDTGSLKTTGALVLGRATTAGSDGLGSGAQTLTVSSITNETATPIALAADSGSSFELYASGDITLSKPLTSFQDTIIDSGGTLTINDTLATSDNNLTITAGSVVLGGSGTINLGSGSLTCSGDCTALNALLTGQIYWDGEGGDFNWFTALNWSNNQVPLPTSDVTIDTNVGFGTILIAGGTAQAKSLVVGRPLVLSSGALELTNSSNFSDALTFSGGSLLGSGGVTVNGPNGALSWSGGVMESGGTFILAGGSSGTLGGTLFLNRPFQNDGVMTLNSAAISGSGSITNNGTLTAIGTNTVNKMHLALGSIGGSGSLVVDDWSRTGGVFNMTGNASLRVPTGDFVVDQTYSAGNLVLLAPGGDIVLNSALTGTGSGTTVTLAAGSDFTNNVGASAIDPDTGRWLVYSTNPSGNTFGNLVSGNKAVWGRTYPDAVVETGSRYVFADAGAVTVTTTDASKTYGNVADVSSNYVLSGDPLNAAGYGNVFIDAALTDVFASGPTISSAGSVATASVAGGPYSITGTGTANSGFSLTFVDSGLLTVNKADFTSLTGTKTYDGSAAFTSGQLLLTGVNSETFTLSSATADSANATVNGGATTFLSAGTVTGGGNYNALDLGALATNTATITRADYSSLTGTKTYDGSAAFTSGQLLLTGVNSETFTLSSATADSANATVNGGATTFLSAGTVTGGGNYNALDLGALATNTATITRAALSVTANSTAKTYGQTVSFDGSEFLSSGLQNSETIGTVTLTSTGAAATAGVAGSPYAITPSTATGGTFEAGNYTISYNDGTLTLNPAVIGLAGSRLYDGTTDFGAAAFGVINGVNGETLTVAGGTGTVPSATVSAGVQLLSPGSLALGNGSGMASNYTLAGGSHTGTILPDPGNFQWVAGSGGNWDAGSNWNQGIVPVAGAVVTIPDIGVPGLSDTITYRSVSGDSFVKSLTSSEGLALSGGTLSLGATLADVSTIPQVTLAGGALGGSGTLNVVVLNLLAGGLLKGSGTIVGNVSNAGGTLAPGTSPGTLTIDGDYIQGASGTLAVEIGGALPGTQYDQLVVTGNATLDGALDVSLINGFVPVSGNTFTIIQGGGTVSGSFATTAMPAAPTMTASYLASAVTVTSGSLVNTDQLVTVQADQTNNAPPANDVGFGSGPVITSGQVVTNAYVDTSGGQIALAPVDTAQPGIYTNVATGETTLVDADSMPDPGIYLSADQKTVVVVTWDQESGKLVVMTGSAEQFGSDVKSGAQVKKPGVCS